MSRSNLAVLPSPPPPTRRPKLKRPVRRQPSIVGQRRLPAGTALLKRLEEAIQDEMRHYNVSRSFVIASCCAFALGVEAPDYHTEE